MSDVATKRVYGFENYYITNSGEVFNSETNKRLSPVIKGGGYLHLGLWKDGKQNHKTIHRLLMETFNPVENMHELKVDHINGDKTDNRLENLRWCTQAENIMFSIGQGTNAGYNRRRTVMCVETGDIFESCADAGRKLGTSQGSVYNCCSGRSKTAANRKLIFLS